MQEIKSMKRRLLALSACLSGCLMLVTGCSGSGAASEGGGMTMNLLRKDSHLKIWLDGLEGKQDTLKKAATGYSRFNIKEPVAETPKLKFEIQDPDKFGRITMVVVSIYQKFEADYSHQAEFTIVAKDANNPQAQMKPGMEYDLGNPGPDFKVFDLTNKEVTGIKLLPGMKYQLQLSVKADKSETGQVFFETK
jgi:hypothetical protein